MTIYFAYAILVFIGVPAIVLIGGALLAVWIHIIKTVISAVRDSF